MKKGGNEGVYTNDLVVCVPGGHLRRGGILVLKPRPRSSFAEMPPWPDARLWHSIHELHLMHRKALLQMLAPTFPHGSVHTEIPTWVFTISYVTVMSARPWITGGFGAGEGMIRSVNHTSEVWTFGVRWEEVWSQGLNLIHLQITALWSVHYMRGNIWEDMQQIWDNAQGS